MVLIGPQSSIDNKFTSHHHIDWSTGQHRATVEANRRPVDCSTRRTRPPPGRSTIGLNVWHCPAAAAAAAAV